MLDYLTMSLEHTKLRGARRDCGAALVNGDAFEKPFRLIPAGSIFHSKKTALGITRAKNRDIGERGALRFKVPESNNDYLTQTERCAARVANTMEPNHV